MLYVKKYDDYHNIVPEMSKNSRYRKIFGLLESGDVKNP